MSPTAARRSAGTRSRSSRSSRSSRAFRDSTVDTAAAPRAGAKRTVTGVIRQLPQYLRLLFGLLTDKRVSIVDKVLVAGAIAYIIAPVDLIPDFLPFIGEVDDVFLLVTALERLIRNAGRRLVLQHWGGDPGDLSSTTLRQVMMAASFFLPRRMRRRLRTIGRV